MLYKLNNTNQRNDHIFYMETKFHIAADFFLSIEQNQ